MKAFLRTFQLSLLATFFVFAVGCSSDDDNNDGGTPPPEEFSIFEIVEGSEDHTMLEQALVAAGLDGTLDGTGSLTLFAPTDAAFEAILDELGITFEDLAADQALLTNILLNHVVDGTVLSTQLTTGYGNTLATNEDGDNLSLYINTAGGVTLNGVSSVTTADVEATNGVVHVVDGVITLPTVATFAIADEDNFSALVGALAAQGLDETVGGTDGGPFTVFAPVNSAFEALETVPEGDALTAVLLHHVIAPANIRSEDLNPDADNVVETLQGDSVTITLPPTLGGIADITDGSGNTGSIIVVDVQAINGVIHAVDSVLIPDTSEEPAM